MSASGGAVPALADSQALLSAIAELAQFATVDFVVEDLLRRLCDASARAMHVDGVGVMGMELDRSRFLRASHSELEPMEQLQEVLQSGPCRDAIDSGVPIAAAGGAEISRRWPAFHRVAELCGIGSVVALPLMSRGRCWGSLDLYWHDEHEASDAELASALLLADVAVSYVVMAYDRSEARVAQQKLARQALHDQLTDLPNRGLIHELIQHALAAAERHLTAVAVLFVDLDKFKRINDSHGHLVGDVVLIEVARRLVATVRADDSVGRLSGDEFVVLCESLPPEAADIGAAATALATRVQAAIAAPIITTAGELTITASIGIAVTTDGPSPADLIHQADLAMYEAKSSGPGGTITRLDVTGDHPADHRAGAELRRPLPAGD